MSIYVVYRHVYTQIHLVGFKESHDLLGASIQAEISSRPRSILNH